MPGIICHNGGRYNIYSTVSDGFYWESSISREQLEAYTKEEHGDRGLRELPARLERAHKKGHSSLVDNEELDSFLCCNRAGENEAQLTTQECIDKFLS